MLIGQLYRQIRNRFREAQLDTPDLDARLLVSAALKIDVSDLIFKEQEDTVENEAGTALAFAEQRLAGMPVGRVLGEREFYGRLFHLNPATLEPRPDTETLIDAVLARTDPAEAAVMCDIGTGTGAIAVTLLAERPKSLMVAVDVSQEALSCAIENAELHQVGERFHPVCADYTSAFGAASGGGDGGSGGFDWVVSNPPYIRTSILADLSREVIQHDPLLALDGGESGLDAYLRIVSDAEKILRPGGWIALEIGYDQAEELKKQLRHHGFGAIEIIRDLSGNDRVAVARKL